MNNMNIIHIYPYSVVVALVISGYLRSTASIGPLRFSDPVFPCFSNHFQMFSENFRILTIRRGWKLRLTLLEEGPQ